MIDPATIDQIIDLIGGIILLTAAYYAVMARRSDHPDYRRAYGRAVLQYTVLFLILAYTTFVLHPHSTAWPAQTGAHLWHFFNQMDTVPAHVNGHLTAYYTTLLHQIGLATGTTGRAHGIFGPIEGSVRTIGLVVYTLVFVLISLGAQVPVRIADSIQDAFTTE